jgi:type I restriction enzyme R subunit
LYELPTRQQRVERAFNAWVAEHSSSINPDQARLLSLLRNVVSAAVSETKYVPLDPSIFTRPPFTFQGGRARAEAIFGRDRLTAIMQELNDLIAAA